MAETEWPREIWAAQAEPDGAEGRHVFSEHATVPRFEGDSDRDCAFHRYVDGDIVDSADRYHREMLIAARARANAAEAECDRLRAEIERLRDVLFGIEMLTATGDGLGPQETIEVHLLAAEGRSDDPHAWRADPAAIARLRVALRQEGREDG
ncbi:hypothetical protein DSD19_06100 [Rhodovulum sp. BSW8]|uniref:hypothetical protein n=1 Tax=Rhodovulum sp. BSW8 TaxID=2259645 RepID=UPI000DE3C075|nr:hypothetical protein [Rhodovulum sp. BSW8]RBO54032.1 hypothetical protein DSD19_06100 [Rhodovulum sp. BSW8]